MAAAGEFQVAGPQFQVWNLGWLVFSIGCESAELVEQSCSRQSNLAFSDFRLSKTDFLL